MPHIRVFDPETESEYQSVLKSSALKYQKPLARLKEVYAEIGSDQEINPESIGINEQLQEVYCQLENMIEITINLDLEVQFTLSNPCSKMGFFCPDYKTAVELERVVDELWQRN